MKHTLTILLLCLVITAKGQSKADTALYISIGRVSFSYAGSKIEQFGKGEYEMPGAKYENGKLTITDSAKVINELMKSYILLNERIIPNAYQEMEQALSQQRKLTKIYKNGYESMSNLSRNMLNNQKKIITDLTKKHK